jgi:molecular chaperone Hsp33
MRLKYACDCHRDRFASGLVALGKQELTNLIEEKIPVETVCHFCNKKYLFTQENLQNLLKNSK